PPGTPPANRDRAGAGRRRSPATARRDAPTRSADPRGRSSPEASAAALGPASWGSGARLRWRGRVARAGEAPGPPDEARHSVRACGARGGGGRCQRRGTPGGGRWEAGDVAGPVAPRFHRGAGVGPPPPPPRTPGALGGVAQPVVVDRDPRSLPGEPAVHQPPVE